MRKIVFVLLAFFVAFIFTTPTQADQVTLTFDDVEAWNSAPPYIGEEWASWGIHFVPNDQQGNTEDGGLYDTGQLSGLVTDGTQYVGVSSSTGNAGLVMTFDADQTQVTIEFNALNGTMGAMWAFDDGEEVWSSIEMFGPGSGTKTIGDGSTNFDKILLASSMSTTSPNTVAFDNLTFEGTDPTPPPPPPTTNATVPTTLLPLLLSN